MRRGRHDCIICLYNCKVGTYNQGLCFQQGLFIVAWRPNPWHRKRRGVLKKTAAKSKLVTEGILAAWESQGTEQMLVLEVVRTGARSIIQAIQTRNALFNLPRAMSIHIVTPDWSSNAVEIF
jgi:hypothetical protein